MSLTTIPPSQDFMELNRKIDFIVRTHAEIDTEGSVMAAKSAGAKGRELMRGLIREEVDLMEPKERERVIGLKGAAFEAEVQKIEIKAVERLKNKNIGELQKNFTRAMISMGLLVANQRPQIPGIELPRTMAEIVLDEEYGLAQELKNDPNKRAEAVADAKDRMLNVIDPNDQFRAQPPLRLGRVPIPHRDIPPSLMERMRFLKEGTIQPAGEGDMDKLKPLPTPIVPGNIPRQR